MSEQLPPGLPRGSEPCIHEPRFFRELAISACSSCREVAWFERGKAIPANSGMARLFGDFVLVSRLPALGPSTDALIYKPPRESDRDRFKPFAPRIWFRVNDGLWLSHDTRLLMLGAVDRALIRNLTDQPANPGRVG